jgi:hypothetical protein
MVRFGRCLKDRLLIGASWHKLVIAAEHMLSMLGQL